ncbi:MAG: type II toxin-antitoxin system mRNA interferase toxin, RelE/StbE family [Caldilinea sp.]|nr:type II toxin-antitoxin system mRNA interferase toxin, RelE/StbE family [Caldilinea sp.]
MKRTLLKSATFIRAAKKVVRRDQQVAEAIRDTLTQLSEDAFHPTLKTHKLKGNLAGSWACSVEYDLRIVFEFVQHEGVEAILLETIGTHDEVY